MSNVNVVWSSGVVVARVFDCLCDVCLCEVDVGGVKVFGFSVDKSINVVCFVRYSVCKLFVEMFCFLFVCDGCCVIERYCSVSVGCGFFV